MNDGCPFCRANQILSGKILAEAGASYMIEARDFPGNYLLIPETHVTSPMDLPDAWWNDVKQMLAALPAAVKEYNLSFNIGKNAGQTVAHLHMWVIPREEGSPLVGKGLARLLVS